MTDGNALALLETRTLARGIEAADAMLKQAPVALVFTQVVEPGRHLILVAGTVDDCRASLRRGRTIAGDDAHDELFLAGPHPALAAALEGAPADATARPDEALGLIECGSVAATLLAADGALKQAAVRLALLKTGADMQGKGLVALRGDVDDVESAVARGAGLAEERSMLLRTAVIPRAAPGIVPSGLSQKMAPEVAP